MQDAVRAKNISKIGELLKEYHDREKDEQDRLRQAEANPMDPENQRYLEQRIRQQNIDDSYRNAMENSPEMFGTVIMLYIKCKVNGQEVKAFVDSGAQMTIMSQVYFFFMEMQENFPHFGVHFFRGYFAALG